MSEKKEKGVAVVVTYNRKNELKKCIECLLNQTHSLSAIFVVNNASTDDTEDFLKNICQKESKIKYKTLKENTGGAGGFHAAIHWAYEEGADWIWGMDDDAYAKENALEILLSERKKIGIQNAYWSNCNKDNFFENTYKEVKEWMFVGFFIPREIIKEMGLPHKEYFIYFDDIEYALRIINAGGKIFKIKESIINHKDAIPDTIIKQIGKKKIEITLLPQQKWKTYYFIRNRILMYQNDRKNWCKAIRSGMRHLIKALVWDKDKIYYVWLGLIHGITGKGGKFIIP